MPNVLVPEFSVRDCDVSRDFYCDILGFNVRYARPEEGFCYLEREGAELMLDQIGLGRDFDDHMPKQYPFGRGVNLQILVSDVTSLANSCAVAGVELYLPLEERWYRKDQEEVGNKQFVVADPDGYLLRFFEDMGTRPYGDHRKGVHHRQEAKP
ncbi:MAG: VOC family protein [Paracoccaceae bacterium]